jgi:rhodanese-related sulfurtransferase
VLATGGGANNEAKNLAGAVKAGVDQMDAELYAPKGHLPGARSIPRSELAARFEEIPTVDLVVLEDAYRFLRGHDYRDLSVMREGFAAWVTRGYPVER